VAGKIYVHAARFPKGQMSLYRRADRIQTISRAVAKAILSQSPGLAEKVISIGYPVPEHYFRLDPEISRQKTILYVGRLAREKGVHLLIKAFVLLIKEAAREEASQWSLKIVGPHAIAQGGDGPEYMQELMDLARPVSNYCNFVGPIFDEQLLSKEYRAASIFVYPSLAETGEALGLAPIEGMAAGCAVVVSDLRCFDDIVESGETGLSFDHRADSPEKNLAATLQWLVAEPAVRAKIAQSGNDASRNFQTSAIAKQMLADFELVLANT
jgi:glycosyltransferase involved in cell wall biosynthesis